MAVEELENTPQIVQDPADNIAASETNEQFSKENPDWEPEQSDNVAEELAELKDAHLRLMAEYDNYRKRTLKEKTELIKNGGEKVLVGLLPVLDDFERAMQNIRTAMDILAVTEGIELIYGKFTAYLQQNGVKPLETKGQVFNDEWFDAVATVPSSSPESKGLVIDCVQTGYILYDKVIRHAKVVVAD